MGYQRRVHGEFQSQLSPIQRVAKLNSLIMKTLVFVVIFGLIAVHAVPTPQDETAALGPNPDADADAHYGYWGGYGGWGWGGYGGYYRPWGYGYWGRKKRSTDDEETAAGPNADADADAWYGYYGYARPWGWGGYYRPWGYGYWGRKKRSTDEAPASGPNADASADADAWYGY